MKRKSKSLTLSACMIVRNEENLLVNCLRSVHNHVDEIIIVDTGSTDRTVEIAKSFNARIYHHPWKNDFSLHRNQSISYARGRWIFIIDADEEYLPSTQRSLRTEIAVAEQLAVDALSLRVENSCNHGQDTVCLDSIRIFRRNGNIRYEGIVHNQLLGFKKHASARGRIIHHGYDQGPEIAQQKFARTVNLLQKQISENPANALAHLYLSNSYTLMNRIEDALRESLLTMELVEAQNIRHRQFLKAYFTAARACVHFQRLDEAEQICHRAHLHFGEHIDTDATQALISFLKNDWSGVVAFGNRYRESLAQYRRQERAPEMVEVATYTEEWKICCWMGMAQLHLKSPEEAETLFFHAMEISADKSLVCRRAARCLQETGYVERSRFYMDIALRLSQPAAGNALADFHKAVAFEKAGQLDDAERAYRELIRTNNSHVGAFNNLVGLLMRRNKDLEALEILQGVSTPARNHPALLYSLGLVHSVLGNHTEALDNFDKTLALKPDLKRVNIQKALIYLKKGDLDNAAKCLHKEIENHGDIIPSLITLGEISLHRGDSPQAMVYFSRVIAADPDNMIARKYVETNFMTTDRNTSP